MKKKIVKLLALGLSAVMTASLTACGSGTNASSGDTGTETAASSGESGSASTAAIGERKTDDGRTLLRLGWNYAITSLAPFQAESPAKNLFRSTSAFEALCYYTADGELVNLLAKDWHQTDEDGYEFEVEIYDYIHDWEGNPITADDVVFSIEQIKKSGNLNAIFNKLETVEKLDDYTIRLTMNQNEYGDIQDVLWYSTVVSQKAFEESGDEMATKMVATGPYKITDFVNSSSVTFERTEDYWQTDDSLKGPYAAQNVDVIEAVCITESSQQEVSLETGTIDFMQDMAGHSIQQLEGYDNIDYSINSAPNQYIWYLSANGPLANENLRKAVAYAIDADAVNEAAYEGVMIPSGWGMDIFSDYNTEWDKEEYYPYDVEKAKELISQEGAEGTHLRIVATGTGVTMDEVVQAYLIDAGFDVELVEEELATYLTDATDPTAYDIICITPNSTSNIGLWKIVLDQRNYEAGTTVNGFKDDELQSLLETAGSIEGHTQENMDKLYQYIVDRCYLYSTFNVSNVCMWRTDSGIVETAVQYGGLPYVGGFTYSWN